MQAHEATESLLRVRAHARSRPHKQSAQPSTDICRQVRAFPAKSDQFVSQLCPSRIKCNPFCSCLNHLLKSVRLLQVLGADTLLPAASPPARGRKQTATRKQTAPVENKHMRHGRKLLVGHDQGCLTKINNSPNSLSRGTGSSPHAQTAQPLQAPHVVSCAAAVNFAACKGYARIRKKQRPNQSLTKSCAPRACCS